MIGFGTTLTHSLRYFWSYLAVAAVLGAVTPWVIASLRARGRAADGLRPLVRPRTVAAALAMGVALYVAVTCVAGSVGAHMAWKLAGEDRSEEQARRVIRWAKLGSLSPFHRQRSLDAIGVALDVEEVEDPQAHSGLVYLAASYDHHVTGSCRDTLDDVDERSTARFTAELAELCGDAESLRFAATARLSLGEFDRAAELLGRASALDGVRPGRQVELERSAFLLAGRLERAAATIREMQARVDDFYSLPDDGEQPAEYRQRVRGVLGCAADQLSARAGDEAARARLQAASAARAPRVRWTCALLLADLAAGAERLAVADRIREGGAPDDRSDRIGRRLDLEPIEGDRMARWNRAFSHRFQLATTLDLLELEGDPARSRDSRAAHQVTTWASIAAGARTTDPVDAVKWAALERLASVADPALPVRRQRAMLVGELVVFASLLGDDDAALRWTDMLDRDREALVERGQSDLGAMAETHPGELAIRRAYVELRAGRPATRPQSVATPSPVPWVVERRRELDGVVEFVERGRLDTLREPGAGLLFARVADDPAGIFGGLKVAARGSGDELARWLDRRDEVSARAVVAVALLGARRVTTGHQAMLAWLRRTPARWRQSLTELAVDAANRQKIAEALGDRSLAADYRAQAAQLRRGLLRRDTALVRRLLAVD